MRNYFFSALAILTLSGGLMLGESKPVQASNDCQDKAVVYYGEPCQTITGMNCMGDCACSCTSPICCPE